MSRKNGTRYLSENIFRHNIEVLQPIQEDFFITMARVPKERILGIEAYAAVDYTKAEIEKVEDEGESDGENVLL